MLEKKLQEELNRYKAINKYAKKMIMEQEALPADPALDAAAAPADPALGGAPVDPALGGAPVDPALGGAAPAAPMDTTASDAMGDTEEIDITDLVNMTKSLKKDIEGTQNDHSTVISKMDDVFTKLDDLAAKLGEMDTLVQKIEQLGAEVKQMKPETPEERLEMRSLDSYPFNQKPTDFFSQKQAEMRASGKNEYVLTKDAVNDFTPETLRDTFNDTGEENEDEFKF
jgi:hypothetical protein